MELVKTAFNLFWEQIRGDDFQIKQAAKIFAEGSEQLVQNAKITLDEQSRQQQIPDQTRERLACETAEVQTRLALNRLALKQSEESDSEL